MFLSLVLDFSLKVTCFMLNMLIYDVSVRAGLEKGSVQV